MIGCCETRSQVFSRFFSGRGRKSEPARTELPRPVQQDAARGIVLHHVMHELEMRLGDATVFHDADIELHPHRIIIATL